MPRFVGLALLSAALVAAVGVPTAVAAGVRINQLQVVGTHNSYQSRRVRPRGRCAPVPA